MHSYQPTEIIDLVFAGRIGDVKLLIKTFKRDASMAEKEVGQYVSARVDQIDQDTGTCAVVEAVRRNDIQMLEILLNDGYANLNVKDSRGIDILKYAKEYEFTDVANLIEKARTKNEIESSFNSTSAGSLDSSLPVTDMTPDCPIAAKSFDCPASAAPEDSVPTNGLTAIQSSFFASQAPLSSSSSLSVTSSMEAEIHGSTLVSPVLHNKIILEEIFLSPISCPMKKPEPSNCSTRKKSPLLESKKKHEKEIREKASQIDKLVPRTQNISSGAPRGYMKGRDGQQLIDIGNHIGKNLNEIDVDCNTNFFSVIANTLVFSLLTTHVPVSDLVSMVFMFLGLNNYDLKTRYV